MEAGSDVMCTCAHWLELHDGRNGPCTVELDEVTGEPCPCMEFDYDWAVA